MTLALGAPSTQATADQEEAENQFSFEALHASHPNAGSEWTMMGKHLVPCSAVMTLFHLGRV